MKTTNQVSKKTQGFTLIEMVGVLAVIAVLAALLIPRIFAAINESRINNAAVSYNTVKSAAMMYFGKYGRFGKTTGTAFGDITADPDLSIATAWDTKVLLAEGLIEKPFATKVGPTNYVAVVTAVASTTAPDGSNAAYDLDGDATGTAANDASGAQYVVYAIIQRVSAQDARDLNGRIDGDTAALGAADLTSADLEGRVKYAAPASGMTDVYIYIAHK